MPISVVLKNDSADTSARIDLDLGGSLQELTLGNKQIIRNLPPFDYKVSYASAILFPFVNRIENGIYTYNDQVYQLPINDPDGCHALHGLVYDKTFKVEKQEITNKLASMTIGYTETKRHTGYPFLYEMILKYVLDAGSLTITVTIKNIDSHAFPFSLGWHPYFHTSDLYESFLSINSKVMELSRGKGFQYKMKEVDFLDKFQIMDKVLDDCYHLNTNIVGFKTPDYGIDLNVTSKDTYLQLYTPPSRNALAIEPQNSPANSFNNKMGLQILRPNEIYGMGWKIKLKLTH